MKLITYSLALFIALGSLSACSKDDDDGGDNGGASEADIAKANEFKTYVVEKKFQVSEYYADKPIDYVDTDNEVKQETDLWPYVSSWIRDDFNLFTSNNEVKIQQNGKLIAGNDSAVVTRNYAIGADKDGPYLDFINHEYKPLRYRLVEFNSSYFLVYVNWHSNSKVYSKFSVK
jgi:hypothetical protein